MRLRRIDGPASEPVTVAEVKAHLNVTSTDDDARLATYITSARAELDGRYGLLGRALMPQTWELLLAAFPDGEIEIPLPPLRSLTSIKYYDGNNVLQTLDIAAYEIDATSEPARVYPTTSWPSTYTRPNAVIVKFAAGYAKADLVPEPLKTAIKLRVQKLYDNLRPDEAAAIEAAWENLAWPFRVVML